MLGLPAITVAGFVGAVFFAIVGYMLWNDRVVAGPLIRNPLPLEFWIITVAVVLGALWYAGVKAYRRRHGIDIRLAFRQIPIE